MVEKKDGDVIRVWWSEGLDSIGKKEDLDVVEVGKSRVAEKMDGDPVECDEVSWGGVGEL